MATKGQAEQMVEIAPVEIMIDPRKVNPAKDSAARGRFFSDNVEAVSESDVIHRAYTFATDGQLQPIQVVVRDDGTFDPVFGFTRAAAGLMFVNGFEYNGKTYSDPNFKLRATVFKGSGKDAAAARVIENIGRSDLTTIDHAHNIEYLMDEHKYTPAKICTLYGWNKARVSRCRSLLKAPTKVQELVKLGQLAATTVYEMVKETWGFTSEQMVEVCEQHMVEEEDEDGRKIVKCDLTQEALAEYGRGLKEETDTAEDVTDEEILGTEGDVKPAKEKSPNRSASQLNALISRFLDPNGKNSSAAVATIAAALHGYFTSETSEENAIIAIEGIAALTAAIKVPTIKSKSKVKKEVK